MRFRGMPGKTLRSALANRGPAARAPDVREDAGRPRSPSQAAQRAPGCSGSLAPRSPGQEGRCEQAAGYARSQAGAAGKPDSVVTKLCNAAHKLPVLAPGNGLISQVKFVSPAGSE